MIGTEDVGRSFGGSENLFPVLQYETSWVSQVTTTILWDPCIRLSGPGKRRKETTHSHTPMARLVSLQQIPTLRELYQRSAISTHHGAVGEKFPFSSTLLDRVSV